MKPFFPLACLFLLLGTNLLAKDLSSRPTNGSAFRRLPNLASNPSFETDWRHDRVASYNRFLLLEQSDWGYSQSDGLPDGWMVQPTSRLDDSVARFGKRSLLLHGAATQLVHLAGLTELKEGGGGYNQFRPLPKDLQQTLKTAPLRFGAWCKTKDAGEAPRLSVTVEFGKGDTLTPRKFTVAFARGTHDWEYQQLRVAPQKDWGVAHAASVRLTFQGAGSAWFDGVEAVEELADEINLLPNGGFESLKKDQPAGWSRPVLWTWSRRDYYRFTGWSHGDGKVGAATVSPLAFEGGRSLQLTALPGENLAVKSDPLILNQREARPLRVSCRVRADNLRWVEVMATDEKGQWLPQLDFSGFMGTEEHYRNRILGAGTHDWEYLTKYFAPKKPVEKLTLWLCARGIDGRLMSRNVVGTVWFDAVRLTEPGSSAAELAKRKVKIPKNEPAADVALAIVDFDPGERLWGDNELRLRVRNGSTQPTTYRPTFKLVSPSGKAQDLAGKPVALAAKEEKEILLPYRLEEMCADWRQHYRLEGPVSMAFGTPSAPVSLRLGATYLYPTEKLAAGINLNVTQASLKELTACRVVLRHPKGTKTVLETKTPTEALWQPGKPRPALLDAGHVDARNLIALEADAAGLTVHPANHPVRDCRLEATLLGKGGAVLARKVNAPFGFMATPKPAALPERIERTDVTEGGVLRVNRRPYFFNCFPIARVDLGGIHRLLNFPAGYKVLTLPYPKELIIKPADESMWKQKVQALVKANKDDPKLFGYFFRHDGETAMWFARWKEMAASQRKVAGWVRAVDDRHVLFGAEWLFGHEGLTPDTGKHFDFLDIIDVEAGLLWTPDALGLRKVARRPMSVLVGLECYYYQPVDLLRWRTYEALRQGANGIGICPSGMLAARPETVSFLRGLHGEVSGLSGLLTGKKPATTAKSDSRAVTLWERQSGKERYLVAMRGPARDGEKVGRVTFMLPMQARSVQVMFEGRSIDLKDGAFSDSFAAPFTVRVYRLPAPAR